MDCQSDSAVCVVINHTFLKIEIEILVNLTVSSSNLYRLKILEIITTVFLKNPNTVTALIVKFRPCSASQLITALLDLVPLHS